MSENDEFPAICDNCSGSNPYVKMMRQKNGAECKVCTRPFTVFRWNTNSSSSRSKKTIICMTCARAKNCCQSCMLDLNYGISIQIRDTALKMAGLDPQESYIGPSKNTELKAITADKQAALFSEEDKHNPQKDRQEEARSILKKLSAKLSQPYPLQKPSKTSKKSEQIDIPKNSDFAKLVSKLPFNGSMTPPSDTSISSFFIFGIDEDLPQYAITEYFERFGKLKESVVNHHAKCGYISFSNRTNAEKFAASLDVKKSEIPALIVIKNCPIRVSWGKVKALGSTNQEYHKLSLVARKVMRQLAEKENQSKNSKHSVEATNEKSKRSPSIPPPPGSKMDYKSTKANFEI